MSNGIIVYKSKYGAARQYAAWLAELTGFDCVEINRADRARIAIYDTLIFCGGVYASRIAGLSFLKKHIAGLKDKRLAVFAVGASPYEENTVQSLCTHNAKGLPESVKWFYGRGAWNEDMMTFKDRMLCKMLHKADLSSLEPWMASLMETGGQACDWTDKTCLNPLLDFIR